MSATGYELRAALLAQAQTILDQKRHGEYETLRYLCDRDLIDPKTVEWPTMPSAEEILAEAEKLYEFVQRK